ncbi:type IV pilin-like G/H family protein [Nodularia harveyana UHCC-0300]|uniref:Type IV pilin-like G/H family protein n=1 Tax=Nodularia harveyana UHCC-0300 TaxID=2974287 RepID=A0ABU5UB47_9CYAN|nr:type IV pilin-like G/H family protein [Nodularia harveyana]MEA5580563.1 type IV pilin-like G/H family protein [Nodularia harveyana UHCC-0300]
MKTELKAKFLQHILNKKKNEEGFTLIELLVVIIIIGILSAIALPSFLNQANKAKQSEAKTYVGSLNKGQQAYFTEKSVFGSAVDILGIGINTQTVNYTYTTTDTATTRADSAGESTVAVLRDYSGAVTILQVGPTSDATSIAILCETDTPGAAAIAPTSGSQCAGGSTQVGT